MSTQRTMRGGWANYDKLERGDSGRALCRWCKAEVPKGRRSFCSELCVHEWRIRTDTGYLRDQVYKRDKGICARCGIDTGALHEAVEYVRNLFSPYRLNRWAEFLAFKTLVAPRWPNSLWDADHIVPVVEGGGQCDLANVRTLCTSCHKATTAQLAQRRALQRRAKRQPSLDFEGDQ